MVIGILADTHNDIELTIKALNYFRSRDIRFLIHAGDLTSHKMLDLFKDFTCRFVLGNGDIDSERINESCENYGFGCVEASSSFEYSGKKFFVFHGDDVPLFRTIVALQEYDYIIKGHTHFFEDYFRNNSHIINPGSVHSIEHTVAVLHIDTDEVEKIVLDEIDLDNEDEQSASYDD